MVDGKFSEKETLPVVPYKKASAVDGGGAVKGVAESKRRRHRCRAGARLKLESYFASASCLT